MTRFIYGGGGDGDIIKPTGVPFINAGANVFDARTGGTQITDLQNITGASITTITTDSFGQAIFYGPDNYIAPLWLDFGSGVRWALSPKAVDLAATRAIAVQRAADALTTTPTTKASLPYNTADPLEQALANALDPLVIPRFASVSARDAAFPSPVNGDRCWRNDLAAEQTFNGQIGLWRTTNFASSFGSVGGTVVLSNSATETSLSAVSAPANIVAGATYRVTAYGTLIVAASTTPNVTFRLRIGGIPGVIAASNNYVAASTASPGLRPWKAEGMINVLTTGVSGTWFANLTSRSAITSTTTLNQADAALRTDGTAAITRDTTVTQSLTMSAQWSAASASNICTQHGWSWERVC